MAAVAKKAKAPYVGEKVTVKIGGNIKTGEVIEVSGSKFCIEWPNGDTEWIPLSDIVR